MSVEDYIEENKDHLKRDINYEIWKLGAHDRRVKSKGIATGFVLGYLAGIFTAACDGKTAREQLKETINEGKDAFMQKAGNMASSARETYEDYVDSEYTNLRPDQEQADVDLGNVDETATNEQSEEH